VAARRRQQRPQRLDRQRRQARALRPAKQHGGNNVDFVFPQVNSIWFGWWLYQGGPTPSSFDLWLDDLALATTRIGC